MSKPKNDNELLKYIEELQIENERLLRQYEKLNLHNIKKNFDESVKIDDIDYSNLLENLLTGFAYHEIILDKNEKPVDCRYLFINKKFEDIIGFTKDQIIGKTLLDIQPDIEPFWIELYGDVAINNKTVFFEHYSILLDKYLQVNAYSPEKGKFIAIFNDITEHKLREIKLLQSNKALTIFGNISNLISESKHENEFYDLLCKMIIETGKYQIAWIGKINTENKSKIDIIANNGSLTNYELPTNITLDNNNNSKCPACISVIEKKIIIVDDKNLRTNSENWFNSIKEYGIQSAIAIPIFINKKIYATLNIYSSEINEFQIQDIDIFGKLSASISNGINLCIINATLLDTVVELQERSDKINATLKALPDILFEVNSNGVIVDYYSRDYSLPFTPEKGDLVGKKLIDSYPTKIAIKFLNAIKVVYNTHENSKVEYSLTFKNKEYYFEATLSPKGDQNRGISSIIFLIRNITSHKTILQQLSDKEKNLSTTLDSIGDAIIVTDIKYNVTRMNPIAEKLTGWTFEEAKNEHIDNVFDIYNSKTGRKVACPVKKVIKKGSVVGLANHTILKSKKGNNYYISDSAAPIINEKGLLIGVIMVFRDISERYEMERMIKENEERYRIVAEQTGQLIYDYDINSGKIIWSGAIVNVTGYSEKEFQEVDIEDWESLIHPEDKNNALSLLFKAMKNADLYKVEYRFRQKNGKYIYIEDDGIFLKNKKGKSYRMLGTMKDITLNKIAQRAVIENEEKFRSIVENSPNPIALIDTVGKTKYLNNNFTKLFGYTIDEIPDGETFNKLVFPDENYREEVNRDWYNTVSKLKKNITESREYIVTCKDKSVKNIIFKLVNLDESTSILFFNDITNVRKAFQVVVESEENLKVTLNSIGDAVIVTDKEGYVVRMNPVAEKLTGYKLTKALGKNIDVILNIVNSKTGNKAINPVQKVLTDGKIVGLANHTELISKNGKRYHIDDSAAPIINFENEIIGVVLVFHDITDKYLLNEQNKETTRKLENLLSNLPGLVYRCQNDLNWTMEFVSEGSIELTGYSPSDFISNNPTYNEIIIPEHREIVWHNIQNNLEVKKPFQLTYKIKCKDNSIKWVWENGSGVFDSNGKLVALEGFIYDITDEHLAKALLYESESKFSTVFKSSPNGIFITTLDGYFVDINAKAISTLEYSSEFEIVGKRYSDIGLWYDINDRKIFIDTLEKHGELNDFEAKFVTKNKKIIFCQISSKIILIDNISHIITIAIDITEKIVAQNKLVESEKRYKQLLKNSPTGIVVFDINTFAVLFSNKKMHDMLGFNYDELIDFNLLNLLPEKLLEKMNITFNNNIDSEYYIPLNKKDGSIIYCDISTNFIKFDGKDGIIGFFNDTSDRKKTEDAFKREYIINQSVTKLARELMAPTLSIEIITELTLKFALQITNSISGYVTTIDPNNGDNIIHSFSNLKDKTNIISNQKIIIRKSNQFYEGIRGISLNTKKSFYTNDLSKHTEYKSIPDWHIKINNFLSIPALFDDLLLGQIAISNSIVDYSENDVANIQKLADLYAIALYRKISEEQLIIAKQKAEESDKLKTNFLENMSHEIRTPMNGIIGFSELLKEKTLSFEQRNEYIGFINNSCNVLSNLIDDIIDISKIESGQLKIDKSDFSLDFMLYELLAYMNEEKFRKNKNNLVIKLSKPEYIEETRVHTDQHRLRQIITNLLNNALKFTDTGFIEFGYKLIKNTGLEIFVKDSGIGIPKEKIELVFERFRQVDETPKRSYGGAGLGLSISKNLTELLDGDLSVTSEYKTGSDFLIKFNKIISNRKNIERFSQNENDNEVNFEKYTILLVEDDQINSILIQEILKKTKVNIIHVYNGNDAIVKIKENNVIDLILMDIQLPGINGYEALQGIKKINSSVPIIAQTAYAMLEEKTKLISAGFDDFIIKPINIEKLIFILRNFLHND